MALLESRLRQILRRGAVSYTHLDVYKRQVQEVIARLRVLGAVSVRTLDGIQETIKFPLPKGLKL